MNYENIFKVKMKTGKAKRNKSYSFNKHESRDQETEAWWSDPKKNWFKNIIELIIIEAIIKRRRQKLRRMKMQEKMSVNKFDGRTTGASLN